MAKLSSIAWFDPDAGLPFSQTFVAWIDKDLDADPIEQTITTPVIGRVDALGTKHSHGSNSLSGTTGISCLPPPDVRITDDKLIGRLGWRA